MSESNFTFQKGDRVAERPKNSIIVGLRRESAAIAAANNTQRYGTVLGYVLKRNSRKQQIKYCEVLWDGSKSPSLHAQHRLCHIQDHETIVQLYRQGLGA